MIAIIALLVFTSSLFTSSCAQEQRILRSRKGILDFNGDSLTITCKNSRNLITEVIPPLNETVSIERITIASCKMPDKALVDVFHVLNISSTNISTLNLNFVEMDSLIENFTVGLNIRNLEVATKRKRFAFTYDFFKTMTNLTNLTISGAELPSIPPNLEYFNIIADASIKSWDGCQTLKELSFWKVQKKHIPEKWPASCIALLMLNITETSEETAQYLIDTIVLKSPNLRSLAMVSCRIHDVPFTKLLNNIVELDLRNNHLSGLKRDQASMLFATRARRVWLDGNPIDCYCENNQLVEALHMNQSQVVDYEDLKCFESGKLLRTISVPEICKFVPMSNFEYGLGYVWGLCCSLSVFSVILLVLTRRYGPIVRSILYSRGCCVSCLKNSVDSDRPYDAFLSFSHGDDQFVLEELLPRLESTPDEFRVCIHYRDWTVGEWIPAQIMQSVRLSKRTIIVLSKNFVQSWWGVLEFRYAHASAMAEGRSRLLVLILDDVLNEKLTPELQGYLEYHTFLRCNDPFFWDKLRYAMPHKDNADEEED